MHAISNVNTAAVVPSFAPVDMQNLEEYTPSNEFWDNMDAKLKKMCKEYGIL